VPAGCELFLRHNKLFGKAFKKQEGHQDCNNCAVDPPRLWFVLSKRCHQIDG
jgi:hypothetical protein